MLVIKYICSYCHNGFWGEEIQDLEEGEGFCPHCGRKGTLKVDERKWDVNITPPEKKTKKPKAKKEKKNVPKTFCSYESMEIARKKLKKHSEGKVLSLQDAITIIRYTDPVPLPYGVTVRELLELMETEKGYIQIKRIKGEITSKSEIAVIK